MKLIYCHADVYNPGGMERVLLNKLRWWVQRGGYEVMLVTTDQHGRPPFYDFPPEVRMVDLGINYKDDNGRNPIVKTLSYLRKRKRHKQALTELLMREKADVVISLYPSESSFIPDIQDGSLKMLELHFNKQFRLQYNRKGLLRLADRIRTKQDEKIVRRFDNFIVLTRQDAEMWGHLPNLSVMPNAVVTAPHIEHKSGNHRVIAVGRLDYQKGFDRLLDTWALLPESLRATWRLDIFGQGEWEEKLKQQIVRLGIGASAAINKPTNKIFDEYAASDFLVMTSHYEGFPMVMLEAMACGLPILCFDFLCGPRDIIAQDINGLIVPDGNLQALAGAMLQLMMHPDQLAQMSAHAKRISEAYSQDSIMKRWELFITDQLRKK
ncbi:MAG: glycosyltransferase family 4 protein [Bacteroidales bacterium]|nr:glycosyltransferase family 4 protein [Bacteroidales bacterium]